MINFEKQLKQNTLTLYFNKNGQVAGSLNNRPLNTLQNDVGTYMIKDNGALCMRWRSWNQAQPVCIYIYPLNDSYLFVDEVNNRFESLVLKTHLQNGNTLSNLTNTQIELYKEHLNLNGSDDTIHDDPYHSIHNSDRRLGNSTNGFGDKPYHTSGNSPTDSFGDKPHHISGDSPTDNSDNIKDLPKNAPSY